MRNSLPMIYQTERAECGLACIAMVLSFHGNRTSMVDLRRRFELSSNGISLDNLVGIALESNMTARPLKVGLEQLNKLTLPAILHWDMTHFVVLKSISKGRATIHDPAKGIRVIAKDQLGCSFTGVALELMPSDSFRKCREYKRFKINHLWSQITGLKRNLGKLLFLAFIAQIFVLATPYYLQTTIDRAIPSLDSGLLWVLALAFGLVLCFQQITSLIRTFIVTHLQATMNIQLSANLFKHLLSLPMAYFQKRDVGDVVTRFESLKRIKDFLTQSVVEGIVDIIMVISLLTMMFYYAPSITAVVLVFVTTYTGFRIIAYRQFRHLNEEAIATRAKERSDFIENIQNIQTTMAFDAQHSRLSQWINKYTDFVNATAQVSKTSQIYQIINSVIFGVENILVVYLFAVGIMNSNMTIGMLTAFLSYKFIFTQRYSSLIAKCMEYWMLGLHLERVADIAMTEPVNDAEVVKHRDYRGQITLNNIGFKVDDFSPNIFENVNLKIASGEHIAITGPSGIGKSTLGKIILGLTEPSEGHVYVDGRQISEFGRRNFRRHVATVMQDDRLSAGTILENITFFDPTPELEWAQQCAKAAVVHQAVLRKPMGYNTLIGPAGGMLSGGEKQRILLARALYRRPKLLLVDEATSNLDGRTEKIITEALGDMKITRIVIAHRPQTIRLADRVMRLTREGLVDVTSQASSQEVLQRPTVLDSSSGTQST